MSNFTKRMMISIDDEYAACRQIEYYNTLHQQLGGINRCYGEVPMIFPVISELGLELRQHFIVYKDNRSEVLATRGQ
jgi:hypothetical protein